MELFGNSIDPSNIFYHLFIIIDTGKALTFLLNKQKKNQQKSDK